MNLKDIIEKMHNKKLYYCNSEELIQEQTKCLDKLFDFNNTRPTQQEERQKLLKEMFAEIGKDCYIEPPLHSNWGGKHVYFGDEVYANFNLTLVDDTDIYVGSSVMFGPNVTLATATHPIHPELRRKQAQYNLPIHIMDNVWIGANVVVMPGVTIGENTVIGAGSVVTKDIPANVVAIGIPCKVLRKINEEDLKYYNKDVKIDII